VREVTLEAMNFDFLWWMRLVAFFPRDMMCELQDLGADEATAFMAAHSEGAKEADPIRFYKDFKDETWCVLYMERCIATWNNLERLVNRYQQGETKGEKQ
jgi:hypothetical protein